MESIYFTAAIFAVGRRIAKTWWHFSFRCFCSRMFFRFFKFSQTNLAKLNNNQTKKLNKNRSKIYQYLYIAIGFSKIQAANTLPKVGQFF